MAGAELPSAVNEDAEADDAARLLRIYLQDHYAGASAGSSLVQRCRRNNEGTPFAADLQAVEAEISEDRQTLEAIMARLGYGPSRVKSAIGSIAEAVARVKTNGRVFSYSPSSRVAELEGLAAGILTKRNLWRALRTVADRYPTLDTEELDQLIDRATSQLDRVLTLHERACAVAFAQPA